ncbi:hypothetical protein COLO4_08702 [Corchorus olitorius]|uniref:Uncharacterized protein n=1 Tax=Corchorus olitorius TaxID=93759 RepID=A0A1R3KF33_9ROSI|nr:hypothetical protein COLO4_08702 [Corchorus olitorius]
MATLEIEDLQVDVALETFTAGIKNEHLRYALATKPPEHMHELFEVAQRYAEADEMRALHDDIHKHYASRSIHPNKEDHQRMSISSRKDDRCHQNYQRSRL